MKKHIPVTKATHLPNFKFLCQNIAALAVLNKHFAKISLSSFFLNMARTIQFAVILFSDTAKPFLLNFSKDRLSQKHSMENLCPNQ